MLLLLFPCSWSLATQHHHTSVECSHPNIARPRTFHRPKAFSDYQRQLWDPLSVPMGLDMNDVGYARGGAGIDSAGLGDGFADEAEGGGGEWHFHVFGETVGLFALDVRHGSAGLQV